MPGAMRCSRWSVLPERTISAMRIFSPIPELPIIPTGVAGARFPDSLRERSGGGGPGLIGGTSGLGRLVFRVGGGPDQRMDRRSFCRKPERQGRPAAQSKSGAK